MPRLNPSTGELVVKIVYYGPGRSGKTTNLAWQHAQLSPGERSELVGLDSSGDRTLFFEYFSADLGSLAGQRLRAEFYTVPGQDRYRETRRLVLRGADGVVVVMDSARSRLAANLNSLKDLQRDLLDFGQSLQEVPLVFQWNKRDLPGAVSVEQLSATLNLINAPEFEATATRGQGVESTRNGILTSVFTDLKRSLLQDLHRV